jgi:hypothetical protein
MNPTAHGTESDLCAAFAAEAEQYARAVQLLEQLPTALHEKTDGGKELLQQLELVFQEVGQIEARIADLKRHWISFGRPPGPALHRAMRRVGELLERLIRLNGRAETCARELLVTLAPQLDTAIHGQRMQRAYGAASLGNRSRQSGE